MVPQNVEELYNIISNTTKSSDVHIGITDVATEEGQIVPVILGFATTELTVLESEPWHELPWFHVDELLTNGIEFVH